MDPGTHTAQHLFMFLFECQDACSATPPLVGGSGSSITDAEDQFQDFPTKKQPLIFVLNCKNWNKKVALLLSDGKCIVLLHRFPLGLVLSRQPVTRLWQRGARQSA